MFFQESSLNHKAHRNLINNFIGVQPYASSRAVQPTAVMMAESKKLMSKQPQVSLEWNQTTGTPMWMEGNLSEPMKGTATEASRTFLMENRTLLGIGENIDELPEVDSFEWEGLQIVRHQQTFQGIPIFGAEAVVALDANNQVSLLTSNLYKDITLKPEEKTISLKKARQSALEDLGKDVVLRGKITSQTILYPSSQGHVKVYHLTIPVEKPLGVWNYFIDVQTGEIVDSFNSMRFYFAPRARVFPENPDETPLTTVMLHGLRSPFRQLDGTFCKVFNEDASAAVAGDNYRFDYTPENTHFDECQVYYGVEKVYRYFLNLGFRGFKVNNPYGKTHNGQMAANVHVGTDYDNAYYDPSTGQISFGDGSYASYPDNPYGLRDLAKEVDVIAHEFTHALIDEYRPGIAGTDGEALHEGYADYFASSLLNDPDLGEYVVPAPEKAGMIRSCENNFRYPDASEEPHDRGSVWAGACWDLRKEVGQEVADYLIFGSILLMSTTTPTFKYAKDMLLLVDKRLCGSEYQDTIKRIFEVERSIPV